MPPPSPRLRLVLFSLAFSLCIPVLASADALVRSSAMQATTIVEIFIEEDQIRVELEIGGRDVEAFRNLMPDAIYQEISGESRPQAERLREFFERDLFIAVSGGDVLEGRIEEIGPRVRVRRDTITGEAIRTSEEEAETVIFARLRYPFEGKPKALDLGANTGSSIGFVVYHLGVAVNDFRYLARSFHLNLDWKDPWYSRFNTRSLVRQYFAPMSGFIYVEPYEVRKEVIVRPLDLQHWLDLGLAGRETIPVEIQPELKRRVAEFLRGHHPVRIDGEEIKPELARIHFLERTLRTSRVIDPPEELDIYAAVLGVIFVYPTKGLPEQVTMEWDLWSERLTKVPVSAVDQAGPLPSFLEPDWNVLTWQNFLKNPELPTLVEVAAPPSDAARAALWLRWILGAITIGAAIAGWRSSRTGPLSQMPTAALAIAMLACFWLARDAAIDESRAREVVAGLLHNIYRAFDYREEERIYDVLARSAEGDLLEQIYLETRRGLVLASQGGARAKVKEIEIGELAARPGEGGSFIADVSWNVAGSVGHWGHVHQRRNRVRAELTIAREDDAWKLSKMQVLEEERL